ncbi:NAD(P)-dependent oxidoreductase [uncultured Propionivibrio sp.]|uniref:NAD(P)-dependent oxidoreductase n=1 Tax=uncultured Propionivibrio sp. TaxID=426737 RepID=UPI0029BFF1D4|nr:NAD(P)-dependent oxidoreductase [uncultured Propionivibrio sp.]
MKKIGFVGLGIMGLAMAENLLKAGYELSFYVRSADKGKSLEALGATRCPTPAAVAAGAEAVIVMVSADDDVEAVVLGENGLSSGAKPGLVILNSSTILPLTSIRIAEAVARLGVVMLDCPVTGSAPQAKEGKLGFMVGGDKAVFDRCQPLFMAMGKAAFHLGASGSGSYAKLANNTMYAINLLSFIEAVSIVAKSGIDPELFLQIVGQGGAKSAVSEAKLPKIIGRDFSPAFSLAMLNKDARLVTRQAGELGVSIPVFTAARAVYGEALERGWGDEDLSSVVKLYEAWSGHVIDKQH